MAGQEQGDPVCVIGIVGPSCSGKTTLATELVKELRLCGGMQHVSLLHQDDYYKHPDEVPTVTLADGAEVHDWDSPMSIDMTALASACVETLQRSNGKEHTGLVDDSAAKTSANTPKAVVRVVEGTMLLSNHLLRRSPWIRLWVFLDTPYAVCARRRATRTYEGTPEHASYFECHGWPSFWKHLRQHQQSRDDQGSNSSVPVVHLTWNDPSVVQQSLVRDDDEPDVSCHCAEVQSADRFGQPGWTVHATYASLDDFLAIVLRDRTDGVRPTDACVRSDSDGSVRCTDASSSSRSALVSGCILRQLVRAVVSER